MGDTYFRPGRDYSRTTCSCGAGVDNCDARQRYSQQLEASGFSSGYRGVVPMSPTWLSQRVRGSRPEWLWRLAARIYTDQGFLAQEGALSQAFPAGYVDGSKYLLRPELLSKIGAEVRVIHLVRDPAVVVHSAVMRHDGGRQASEWFERWRRYVSAAIRVSERFPSSMVFYEESRAYLEQRQLPENAYSLVADWPTGQEGPHAIGNRSKDPTKRRPDASQDDVQEFREVHRGEVERCVQIDPRLGRYAIDGASVAEEK